MKKYFVVFDFTGRGGDLLPGFDDQPREFAPLWELVALMETLEREASHPTAGRALICRKLFEVILLKLASGSDPGELTASDSLKTCIRAARLVEDNFRKYRSVREIAQAAGIEPSYLTRLFKMHGYPTPYRMLVRLRMQYAMSLLTRDGLNVTRASEVLGYENPYHFSRVFKSVHGLPPSKFTTV